MKKEVAPWVVPVVVVVCVLCIGMIAWKALSGNSAMSSAPNREVHAGMYDFRKEAASGNLGRKSEDSPLLHH